MSRRPLAFLALAIGLVGAAAEARVVRVAIARREPLLGGKPFGLAGPYETLVGTVELALDPTLRQNQAVVDLGLAPRNERGEVVFTADLYLMKPVDVRRGNGRVYYEVPNRGGKGSTPSRRSTRARPRSSATGGFRSRASRSRGWAGSGTSRSGRGSSGCARRSRPTSAGGTWRSPARAAPT